MTTNADILEHLSYGLKHIDALCWLCETLDRNVQMSEVTLVADSVVLIRRSSLGFVQNPVAEAGLLYCRKLLEFLGLKLDRKTGRLRELKAGERGSDIGVEQLGLTCITLSTLDKTPFGDPAGLRSAVEQTLRSANKGVAHFTGDASARGDTAFILPCAKLVAWLIEQQVYVQLGEAVPDYKIWTAG